MGNPKVMKARKEVKDQRAQELKRLYDEHGELRPSMVVESARDESSPLHNEFEWDDSKAGHEYRLWQARRLIRVTVITMDDDSRQPLVHVPAPVDVRNNEPEGTYHPVSVVVQDVGMFERAIGQALSKLRAAEQAVQELQQAAEAGGNADGLQMAQIALAMNALKTASDVVKSLH